MVPEMSANYSPSQIYHDPVLFYLFVVGSYSYISRDKACLHTRGLVVRRELQLRSQIGQGTAYILQRTVHVSNRHEAR